MEIHRGYFPGSLPPWLALSLLLVFTGMAHAASETVDDAYLQQVASSTDLSSLASEENTFKSYSLLVSREPESVVRYPLLLQSETASTATGIQQSGHSWETGEGKSYLIPALEIPGFLVLLNVFDRFAFPDKRSNGDKTFTTNPSTFWDQLTEQDWTFDQDSFKVNQFGHPYQGATMYGLARSSGLNFWQSFVYSNAGSFLWEMAGETSHPSINDLITTGSAGSLLGEALFRMAGLVLEDAGVDPPLRHQLAAAVISPPTAFNRFAFGDRFKAIYPSHRPVTFWRFMLGGGLDTHSTNLAHSTSASSRDGSAIAEFSMAYGLPGKPGYTYDRPFDYFDFHISARAQNHNLLDVVTIRGLLKGTDYHAGDNYRGIWGLYGSYDYISPELYRVSSTALSLGTTGQYWAASGVALQGSVLGGLGFGATGVETDVVEERGYHYGATPQALLAFSALFGNNAILDVTGRGYYFTSWGGDQPDGSELVFRGHAGLTVRVSGHHALGIQYSESIRETNYDNIPDKYRAEGTLSLVYTFLSDINLGAVEWRDTFNR